MMMMMGRRMVKRMMTIMVKMRIIIAMLSMMMNYLTTCTGRPQSVLPQEDQNNRAPKCFAAMESECSRPCTYKDFFRNMKKMIIEGT